MIKWTAGKTMKFANTVLTAVILASMLSGTPGRAQVSAGGVPAPTYQWNANGASYSTDAPEDVNYFYSDLSPYGQWVDLEGYGWCWQPTVVAGNPQWQPYCDDGHWVYTDAGWFWQSDYPWGWAPFHYGRWLRHEHAGWVWFPDRVWGPAWVTWRTAGNDCGWAPLPLHAVFDANAGFLYNGVRVGANFDFGLPADCFTFVALGDFCTPDLGHHRLAQADVSRIYSRTTIINDYRFANQTVYNGGIPVNRITAVTHADLRPIPVRDEPAGNGEASGVYRRTPRLPEKPAAVWAQKVDEQHPIIQHGGTAPATAAFEAAPGNNRVEAATPGAPMRTAEETPKPPIEHAPQPKSDAGETVEIIGPVPTGPDRPEPPGSLAPYTTRSQQATALAHSLPPLNEPHDEPAPLPPPNHFEHVPRSKAVANQAHALPPLAEKPPPTELAKPGNGHPDAVASPHEKSSQQQP
jgi:hypothetical protein